MAEQLDIVTVLFYVDPESEAIEGVFAFSTLGMVIRENGKWEVITREESRIDTDLSHDDVYKLDWTTDDPIIDESFLSEDFDPDHIAVKMYDNGELDVSELEKYAVLLYEGKDVVDVPEQE